MAIAYDAVSSGGGVGAGDKTWSHTVTGSNTILVVGVTSYNGDSPTVTYNGVSMTQAIARNGSNSLGSRIFYLVNPTTGTNTVSISSIYGAVTGTATSYTGAGGIGATANQLPSAGTNPQTLAVTTTVNNSWLVGTTVAGSIITFAAGTGTTLRAQLVNSGGSYGQNLFDSNGAKTPTGSYSLQSTGDSGGVNIIQEVMEITPYVASRTPLKTLLGAGL